MLLFIYGAVACAVVFFLSNAIQPDLISIPGPFLAKFSNGWRLLQKYRNRYSDEIARLHKKHGKLVRLGPNLVSTSDIRCLDGVLGVRSDFPKSDQVKPNQPLFRGKEVPTMFTTRDRTIHAAIRKPVANAYATTTILSYEAFVSDTIHHFFQKLDKLFVSTKSICDIDNWVQYFAYDVVSAITMSRPFGFIERGGDVDGILRALEKDMNYRGYVMQMPWLDDWIRRNPLRRLANSSGPSSYFAARASKLLNQRLAESSKGVPPPEDGDELALDKTDFVSRFIAAKEKNPNMILDRHIIGYVQTNLVAGSDTTAVVMRTALYYAMRNASIMKRVQAELDTANVTYPVPYMTAYYHLPYTAALIKESLRYHFVGAGMLEREIPPQGYEMPDGTKLRGGTIIGIAPSVIMRDAETYGADADEFKPERWLKSKDETEEEYQERLRKMRATDLSFGMGSRGCLGKHVAELEIYKIIPTILGLFDIKLVHPDRPWKIQAIFFTKQYDMDVTIQWREGKSMADLRS